MHDVLSRLHQFFSTLLTLVFVMAKRATIYLEDQLHRALRLKAAETDRSISDLVNTAVRHALTEDAVDLAAIRDRVAEPSRTFEEFVNDLKERGKL